MNTNAIAEAILAALNEHSIQALSQYRVADVPVATLHAEQVEIVTKILEAEFRPPPVPHDVDILANVICIELALELTKLAMKKDISERGMKAAVAGISKRLMGFRNSVRKEVLDEIASGAATADELLAKVVRG
jgi:hypothetical protein